MRCNSSSMKTADTPWVEKPERKILIFHCGFEEVEEALRGGKKYVFSGCDLKKHVYGKKIVSWR